MALWKRPSKRSSSAASALTVLFLASPGFCQSLSQNNHAYRGSRPQKWVGSGIEVKAPILYDDRSLQLLLLQYQQSIGSASFFNPSSIAANLNSQQGGTFSGTNSTFNLMTTPAPSVTTAATATQPTTSTVNNSGGTNTQTFTPAGQATVPATAGTTTSINGSTTTITSNAATGNTVTTTTVPSISAAIPALATPPSQFNPSLSFGLSSSDILDEQNELQFELMNLQLFLQRPLSDRVQVFTAGVDPVTGEPVATGKPGGHIVLALDVTIDAGSQQKDAAAEVVVTLSPMLQPPRGTGLLADARGASALAGVGPGSPLYNWAKASPKNWDAEGLRAWQNALLDPPQLGPMLPMDKTYNVATVTQDTRSIGLGAFVTPITAGFNSSSTKQNLYLVRDTDTIALGRVEHQGGSDAGLTFGWEFRPVLGRHVVQAGMRRVFASLSLPTEDGKPYAMDVEVQTYWRHYDQKSGTLADDDLPPSQPDSRQKPAIQEPEHWPEIIPSSADVDKTLRPEFVDAMASENNDGMAFVTVHGRNFIPGTTVALGDDVLSVGNGLLQILGEGTLQFTVPERQLVLNNPTIIGPYGGQTPVDFSPSTSQVPTNPNTPRGMSIVDAYLQPRDSQVTDVTLYLDGQNPYYPGKKTRSSRPEDNAGAGTNIPQVENEEGSNENLSVVPFDDLKAFYSGTGSTAQATANDLRRVLVASVGTTVIGFPDNPFSWISYSSTKNIYTVRFSVPTQALRASPYITVQQLFKGPAFRDTVPIADRLFKSGDFTVTGISLVSDDPSGPWYAISGTGFTNNMVVAVAGNTLTTNDGKNDMLLGGIAHVYKYRRGRTRAVASTNTAAKAASTQTEPTPINVGTVVSVHLTSQEVHNATALALYQYGPWKDPNHPGTTDTPFLGSPTIVVPLPLTSAHPYQSVGLAGRPPLAANLRTTPTVASAGTVTQNYVGIVPLTGTNFDQVTAVVLGDGTKTPVDWELLSNDGTKMSITLTTPVTKTAGYVEIDLVQSDGSVVPYDLQVQSSGSKS